MYKFSVFSSDISSWNFDVIILSQTLQINWRAVFRSKKYSVFKGSHRNLMTIYREKTRRPQHSYNKCKAWNETDTGHLNPKWHYFSQYNTVYSSHNMKHGWPTILLVGFDLAIHNTMLPYWLPFLLCSLHSLAWTNQWKMHFASSIPRKSTHPSRVVLPTACK